VWFFVYLYLGGKDEGFYLPARLQPNIGDYLLKHMNKLERIEMAINLKVKIRFNMKDSPQGQYILFHPYAILRDVLTLKILICGLIEKHYTMSENYDKIKFPNIEFINEIILTSEKFNPKNDWMREIEKPNIDCIYKLI
jgi:hypothetical protein